MSDAVGELFVKVTPDTKGFGQALSTQTSGAVRGAMGAIGKTLAIGGVALAAGVGVVLKGATDSLIRIEKINTQTDAAITSMGASAWTSVGQIEGLAGSIEGLTGIEAESIQEGQNLLLTFGNIQNVAGAGNDIFDQTTRLMTDMSVAMGTDVKGGAIQLGKALNDPIKGVSALSRVGVSFTEQQKEQIKTLVESGDVLGAQKVILGELEKQFGGSAEAFGNTTAGKIERVKHAFGTVTESIAAGLLPVVTKFSEWMLNTGMPAFARFSGWITGTAVPAIKDFIQGLIPIGQRILPIITDAFDKVMSVVTPVFNGLVRGAKGVVNWFTTNWDQIKETVAGVFDFISDHGDEVKGALVGIGIAVAAILVPAFLAWAAGAAAAAAATLIAAAPFVLIGAAVAALGAAFVLAYKKVDWFRSAVDAVVGFFTKDFIPIMEKVLEVVKTVVMGIVGFFQTHWDTIRTVVTTVLENVWNVVKRIWEGIRGHIEAVLTVIQGVIKTVMALIQGDWSAVWDGIKQVFSGVWDGIKNILATALDLMKLALSLAWEGIKLAVSAAWEGIKAVISLAWDGIKAVVSAAIDALVAFVVGIPGRIVDIVSTLWDGIKTGITAAKDWVGERITEVVNFVIGIPGRIADTIASLWDNFKDGIKIAKDWVSDRIDDIVGFVTGIPGRIAGVISTMWDNLKNNTTIAKDWIGDRISDVVGFVTGLPGRIFGTIYSLWNGLRDETTKVKDWISDRIDDVVSFATGLPGRMVGIFSGMWDGIKNAFKSAINWVIRAWNGLDFTMPSFSAFGKTVGGWTIGTPDIRELHTGGVVGGQTFAGMRDDEVATKLLRGETVLTKGQVSAIARDAAANQVLPSHLTLIIEGKPFTAMIADYDQQNVATLNAGVR